MVITSRISARRWHEEGILGVVDRDCAHRGRLGDLGQVFAARDLAPLHHIDLDIFAHVVRFDGDRRHCLENDC